MKKLTVNEDKRVRTRKPKRRRRNLTSSSSS